MSIETHGLDTAEQVFFYEQDFYVLSNFSAFSIKWLGRRFMTSEHAYQWAKCISTLQAMLVAAPPAPAQEKDK